MNAEDIHGWADAIESLLSRERISCIDRTAVVRETASTQDVARDMGGRTGGILVVAGRQYGGRGRLGRVWADTSHLGVAATFALRGDRYADSTLSIAAGVAACRCIERLVGDGVVGLRWPNDVVERGPVGSGQGSHGRTGGGRKLAGVLIERSGSLALVGIGINVLQGEDDWHPDIRGRACSLAMLGSAVSRLEVILALTQELDRALSLDEDSLVGAWKPRDVLAGTVQRFVLDGREYRGVVEDISPRDGIVVRLEDGSAARLPALMTSLVHEPGPGGQGSPR